MRISDWSSDVCSSDLCAHDDGIYPRPHDVQADNLRICVARWPHWHGPFEAPPSLTSDLGARWRAPDDHREEHYFTACYPLGHPGPSVWRHVGDGAGRTVRTFCAARDGTPATPKGTAR